jgi:hypothetical protein
MTTIDKILQMKEDNLRVYYIDSDGDEVIVSDDEDYEVALDYAKSKGEGKIEFLPCNRQHNGSEEEDAHTDMQLESKDSFNMVAETVSINEDEHNDDLEKSEDGIEEIDPNRDLEKEVLENNDINNRLNAVLKDTVSRESSLYFQSEQNDVSEKEKRLIKEVEASVMGTNEQVDEMNEAFAKKISESSVGTEELLDEFDVVKSVLNGEQHKIKESQVEEVSPINEEPLEENKVSGASDSIVAQPESEEKSERLTNELNELMEMNKTVVKPNDPVPEPVQEKVEEPIEELVVEEENKEEPQIQSDIPQEPIPISDEEEKIPEVKPEPEEDKKDELEEEEYVDEPRLGVSVSMARASVVHDQPKKKVNYLKKALESLNFVFNHPEKKMQVAELDESEEEKSQDFVVTCKPGSKTKKRWRIINNSNICWPKKTSIRCQSQDVECEIPEIKKPLLPGEKLDISINIKISPEETENTVKVFVFRFHSHIYGYFGCPLFATVEVIPENPVNEFKELSQEEKLKELFEGDDEVNPILYEIANDFVEEGLGTFEQCLEALLQSKANYEDAKKILEQRQKE